MFMQAPIAHIEGDELETVDITLRLGTESLKRLTTPGYVQPALGFWLTEQPDGTYALGVYLKGQPEHPRKVANDDARERLGR